MNSTKIIVNVSSTIQSTVKFSTEQFCGFLTNLDINSIFIKPVDKTMFLEIVFAIFKKDSELKCSNYSQISLLFNIDKILERVNYNRLYEFLEFSNLIYDLQLGFEQKHYASKLSSWQNKRTT